MTAPPAARLRQSGTKLLGSRVKPLRLLACSLLLESVTLVVSESASGRMIMRNSLIHGRPLSGRLLGRSAYVLPQSGKPFTGRKAHGRRHAVARARRDGLVTRHVTEAEANLLLGELGWDPLDCPGCEGRSYAAFTPTSTVLAVTHVHVDGDVVELVRAIHRQNSNDTGAARYALFEHVVADVVAAGASTMIVFAVYFKTPAGVRTFQQILGFRQVNLVLNTTARSDSAVTPCHVVGCSHTWRRGLRHLHDRETFRHQ